jgi:hypothetical protein
MRAVLVSVVVTVSVLAALLLPGCDDDDGGGTGSGVLTRDALIGTWASSNGNVSYEFRADGSLVYEEESGSYEGTWSVTDGVLETSVGGTETEEDVTYTDEWTVSSRAAIVGDILYFYGVGVRTGGSGSSLDGTWELEESEHFLTTVTGPDETYTESEGFEDEETITVNGSTFESSWRNHEFWEGTLEPPVDREESGTTSGTIRVEGDLISMTITEMDGTPVPVPDQEELFVGQRAASNVIVQSDEEVPFEDLGLHRQ